MLQFAFGACEDFAFAHWVQSIVRCCSVYVGVFGGDVSVAG